MRPPFSAPAVYAVSRSFATFRPRRAPIEAGVYAATPFCDAGAFGYILVGKTFSIVLASADILSASKNEEARKLIETLPTFKCAA